MDLENPTVPTPQQQAFQSPADILLYGGSAGGGKGLALQTPIPTPAGFTAIGDLVVGDTVFDQDGEPCRVCAVSAVQHLPCFEVEFDDGAVVVADDVHRWPTMTTKDRERVLHLSDAWRAERRARRPSRAVAESQKPWASESITAINRARRYTYTPPPVPTIRSTAEIAASLIVRGRRNHSIAVASAFQMPTLDLPIDPYMLGLWLGDGFSKLGAIGMLAADWEAVLPLLNWPVERRRDDAQREGGRPFTIITFSGLRQALATLGVLGNKHIPAPYLRASIEQRRELLRGVLDTDGHCDARGRVEIGLSNRRLADDCHELVCGLGIKAALSTKRLSLKSSKWNDSHRMQFHAPFAAFRLPRKASHQMPPARSTTQQRYICAVRSVPSVPTRCIAVDSPSRTYLVGRHFIPTHNTDLLVGLPLTKHRHSIIFRREAKQLAAIVRRVNEIRKTTRGYASSPEHRWNLGDGRSLRANGMKDLGDEKNYQGQAHDYYGFDELTQFLEYQFRYVITWNRTTAPGQRCRVVAASNPPEVAEGDWVIDYWGPWLSDVHPNPALPGDLRWFISDENGNDREVDSPSPVLLPNGDKVTPRSRTFIPSNVEDNPYLMATGYKAQLQALPEPLRSQMLKGSFTAGRQDDRWQIIPTEWVVAAQQRWTPEPPKRAPMTSLGVDVAMGGKDNTVLIPRHGDWFGEPMVTPGIEVPKPAQTAGLVVAALRDGACAMIDWHGPGGEVFGHLDGQGINCLAMVGAAPSHGTDKATGKLRFLNKRAEWWWRMREALDPMNAYPIALPPDPRLKADLVAPRWTYTIGRIKVEEKEGIISRLGRSPDFGDAAVYASAQVPMSRLGGRRRGGDIDVENAGAGGFNPHGW